MFACTTYPHDPAFLRRVEAEAEYNIHRLRNHASLAMWRATSIPVRVGLPRPTWS